jgi:UDP-2,4-diacetamido-2,4,6-trideoxy-beta-L-altropyranose hydrolase
MRCLTLADALSQRGAEIRFISRHLADELQQVIRGRGHGCVGLGAEDSADREAADARESLPLLAGRRWDWLVVDHYALGASWESAMREAAPRIFAIDDLADRPHDCDVLLDQNHLAAGAERYAGKVPAACRVLIGPRHALLRPEYREWREHLAPRSGAVRRVLVCFGGTDPQNMTTLALEALTHPTLAHLAVDIVTGGDAARRLAERVAQRPGTTVYGLRPHLADLMAQADLAVGAGGSTTWERMCLGLRSLVITLADNQVHVAEWLSHEGLIRLVGPAQTATAANLRAAIIDELSQPSTAAIAKGMALCDGHGVERVVSAMFDTEPIEAVTQSPVFQERRP